MPEQVSWETDTLEKLEAFEFDDPYDRRRFFEAGDNQIAGVGDGFERNSPPWVETVRSLHADFPVYGSITEASEITTRLLGPAEHADLDRRGARAVRRAAAAHRRVQLPGRQGADRGRRRACSTGWSSGATRPTARACSWARPTGGRWYKPTVARDHRALPRPRPAGHLPRLRQRQRVSSRTCIEIGLDGYNPLEAKADLDVVELRAAPGPPAHVLRQQRHPRLGARRPRGAPPRGAPPAPSRRGRRLHLHVRPFRRERCVRSDL